MSQKYGIRIMPREVILDSQGRAVEKTLQELNFPVKSCRIGKYIEIEILEADKSDKSEYAEEQIQKMLREVLYNPLIESYIVEKIK